MITLCAEILYKEREEFLKSNLGKLCCVTSCGSCIDGRKSATNRPDGWFDNMITYVTSGCEIITVKNREPICVKAGEVAIVPSSVPYKIEDQEGCRRYFAHFTLGLPLSDFKIPNKLSFYVGESENLGNLFYKTALSLKLGAQNLHFSSIYMLELLCEIGLAYERAAGLSKKEDRFDEVVGIMEDSCRGEGQIGDFAQMCGMSEPAFRKEFIKRMGVTPKQFLISARVRLFKYHIKEFPNESLVSLCGTCGFQSYKYAVNIFRRETGMTPQQYRESTGGDSCEKRYICTNLLENGKKKKANKDESPKKA